MDFKPVLFVVGLLLCVLSVSLALPMLVDLSLGNPDWKVFFFCILTTGFFGGSLVISTSQDEPHSFSVRQAFMLLFLTWLSIATFGAMPFYMSELNLSFADSFFESMSGITTTGGTVIVGLDDAPPGILLWRGILQWLGGIGIILMAMSVLPFLKVGGMQIFKTELSEEEKALPRFARLTRTIGVIYIGLTLICTACYMLAGMNGFNAFAHALCTISTGGFSTFDASFMNYTDPWNEIVAIVFMIAGGIPFVLYVKLVGGNVKPLLRDSQVKLFLTIIAATTIIVTLHLVYSGQMEFFEALRRSSFNIVSVMTGTGFASADFSLWGPFALAVFLFLMVIGGCAGSTTCGIKIFRFQVLYSVIAVQIKRLLHPSGVFMAYYNGRPLADDVPLSVMSFFFIYALSFVGLSLALTLVGLDFLTAVSGAMTSISNVGPGLGPVIGPATTFASLPDSAKWIMSFGMLLGRLEFFTVIVFLLPQYWRH